jgi:hypothetical protein
MHFRSLSLLASSLVLLLLATLSSAYMEFHKPQQEFPQYINEEDTLYPPGHGHHETYIHNEHDKMEQLEIGDF